MQRSVNNYDYSRIVHSDDADEPAVERLPGWVCVLVDTLAALILWLLIGVGLRAAWVVWEAMR